MLIYGPVGVGKTHIAQALGHQACRRGYEVLFTKTAKLLGLPGGDESWEKRMRKYLKPAVLILDDFGLTSSTATQASDFKGGLLRADATHSKHKAPNLKERYTR